MNNKKFSFIICTNNAQYENECIKYIKHLIVPNGYTYDIILIRDAISLASGYNKGMSQSDAKYKIYLHQDVFIVNKNILFDLLKIYEDTTVGMIGLVGNPHLPQDVIPWYGDRVGSLYSCNITKSETINFNSDYNNKYVECIDGLFISTQYDLKWREDLFKHWDMYDISQSLEFMNAKYKIAILPSDTPSVIHDDGISNLANYYNEIKILYNEYLDN